MPDVMFRRTSEYSLKYLDTSRSERNETQEQDIWMIEKP